MHHTHDYLDQSQNAEFLQKTRTLDLKIQNQISRSTNMNARRKLHSKVFERIKESKWGTSCKYMCIKQT